jgi:hypothetical protein
MAMARRVRPGVTCPINFPAEGQLARRFRDGKMNAKGGADPGRWLRVSETEGFGGRHRLTRSRRRGEVRCGLACGYGLNEAAGARSERCSQLGHVVVKPPLNKSMRPTSGEASAGWCRVVRRRKVGLTRLRSAAKGGWFDGRILRRK